MGTITRTMKLMRKQPRRRIFFPAKHTKLLTKMMDSGLSILAYIRKILTLSLRKSIALNMGCLTRMKQWRLWRRWERRRNDIYMYTHMQIKENIKEFVFLSISANRAMLRIFCSTLSGAHLVLKLQLHSHIGNNNLAPTKLLQVFLKKSFWILTSRVDGLGISKKFHLFC